VLILRFSEAINFQIIPYAKDTMIVKSFKKTTSLGCANDNDSTCLKDDNIWIGTFTICTLILSLIILFSENNNSELSKSWSVIFMLILLFTHTFLTPYFSKSTLIVILGIAFNIIYLIMSGYIIYNNCCA
tara:strand:+ start:7524 stop:7913 length:390 start_codon:yes stop_codon:yes gene_type:complete